MPDRFPQEAVLRNGQRLIIRPFQREDTDALYEFFLRLPEEHRQVAWDDVGDRSLVESWGQNIDYEKALPLIAIDEERRVVADATLHRRHGGPLRLVGRIKWLLDPEVRGQGLGTILINNFITIGRHMGLRHLTCMLICELEEDAIATLTDLGFDRTVIPEYGTDPDGKQHDMMMLVMKL